MRTLLTISFALCTILSFGQFEGKIKTEVFNSGSKMTTTWFISDNAIKLQMNYQGTDGPVKVEFIGIKDSSNLIVITDSKDYKGYSLVEVSDISSQFQLDKMGYPSNSGASAVGKYTGYGKKHQLAVWMDSTNLSLKPFEKFFKDEPGFQVAKRLNAKGFPSKSLLTDHQGNLVYSMTVLSIEEQELNASAFKIPDGFEKRDLVEVEEKK